MRKTLLLLLVLSWSSFALGQTLRGKVTEKLNGKPLPGASIQLSNGLDNSFTSTDAQGIFRFDEVTPGRYVVQVSHVGFGIWRVEEVLIQRGKEAVVNVELETQPLILETVEIGNQPIATLPGLGTHSFTVEQSQRWAGAFYDPARLATTFPGVVGTDDQANNLSVRGNSPAGLLWRLEGVNIVNPNHLANAGTFSDRAAPTGGGVNMLSAQLLSSSRVLTGNFGPGYGNTIAGVMDMRLRAGNNQKREHTLQASLLGLEVATEGPLSQANGSSYLINYRYSTVGLLSAAGVNFGNEEITFQDLSFHVALPTAAAGNFTVFGLGGTNQNIFTSPTDPAEWEAERDLHNVTYKAHMGALGGTHDLRIGEKLRVQSAVAFSRQENERTDLLNPLEGNPTQPFRAYDYQQEQLVSGRTGVSFPVSEGLFLEAGLVADWRQNQLSTQWGSAARPMPQLHYFLWQPYLSTQWQVAPKLSVQMALQHLYATNLKANHFQPQATVTYQATGSHTFTLAGGRYGQLPPASILLAPSGAADRPGHHLGFMQSDQFAIGHRAMLPGNWRLKTELYYQMLRQVPVARSPESTFSALNYLNEPVEEQVQATGQGRNYGLETSLEKPLANQYYLLLTGTLYRSLFTPADGRERSSRFDGRFATGLAAGKEWYWQTAKGKFREAGLHLRTTYRGGLRDTPINLALSTDRQQTVYLQQQAFEVQLPNYFRADLRVSLRTNRSHSTRLWYLDIQNVSAYQNVAFQYYDSLLGTIETRNQLGLIPVLGYRVEF